MAEWNGLGRYPEDADVNDRPEEGTLLAYVDGSYQDALKKYGFGCIFILPDGRIYTEYGNGDNPDSLKQRNVSGEIFGSHVCGTVCLKQRLYSHRDPLRL
ncbi:MAG: hypothetical protein ACLTAX_06780 [Waltera sp.]